MQYCCQQTNVHSKHTTSEVTVDTNMTQMKVYLVTKWRRLVFRDQFPRTTSQMECRAFQQIPNRVSLPRSPYIRRCYFFN